MSQLNRIIVQLQCQVAGNRLSGLQTKFMNVSIEIVSEDLFYQRRMGFAVDHQCARWRRYRQICQ